MSEGRPKDWTEHQVAAAVEAYFDIRAQQDAGEYVNKAERHRALAEIIGRSPGSVELKLCNISSILCELGVKPTRGYPRRDNYQALLAKEVQRYVFSAGRQTVLADDEVEAPVADLEMGEVPNFRRKRREYSEQMRELIRKVDPAARDARNRRLGRLGEEKVVEYERTRLSDLGRTDLAAEVRWVADEEGDGAGYDIRSFNGVGEERYLEVKTTNGSGTTPFYLSDNELRVSEANPAKFRIVRLYNFVAAPKAFILRTPLRDFVELRPAVYRAHLI